MCRSDLLGWVALGIAIILIAAALIAAACYLCHRAEVAERQAMAAWSKRDRAGGGE